MHDKKLGRPFTGKEPLNHGMKIMVSETIYKKIEQYSHKKGITVAETVRQAINLFLKKQ